MESAKNNVLENKQSRSFTRHKNNTILRVFHESFSIKYFFVAVFTTFSALLKFREMRRQIARLKILQMFSL